MVEGDEVERGGGGERRVRVAVAVVVEEEEGGGRAAAMAEGVEERERGPGDEGKPLLAYGFESEEGFYGDI